MEQLCLQLVLPYEWHGDCLLNELKYVSSPQGLLLAESQLITAVSVQIPNDALPWTEDKVLQPPHLLALGWKELWFLHPWKTLFINLYLHKEGLCLEAAVGFFFVCAFLQHPLALPFQCILLLRCHLLHISMAVIARQTRAGLTAQSCMNSRVHPMASNPWKL